MKNQPNKATVKDGLPTAEQILESKTPPSLYKRGDCYVGHALDAMQSYSDQQNAELREKLASEIESRKHWQRQTQRYQKYHRELNAALERVKELEAENSIIHECLTELYNWHDNKVGDIVRGYLDRIDDLAGRS